MPKLFSYVVRYDDGAAPNPFWDVCTLVICKPQVRKVAAKGDWIAGTGSKNSDCGDTTGKLIYAMRITEDVQTLGQYDEHCRSLLKQKIPDWTARDLRRKFGDCIYDYSTNPPTLRPSCHSEENRETDLAGAFALLSREFYYFGKNAIPLPASLSPIVKTGRGHKWRPNEPHVEEFVRWIRSRKPGVNGDPQMWGDQKIVACGAGREKEAAEELADASCGDC